MRGNNAPASFKDLNCKSGETNIPVKRENMFAKGLACNIAEY